MKKKQVRLLTIIGVTVLCAGFIDSAVWTQKNPELWKATVESELEIVTKKDLERFESKLSK